MDSRRFAIVVKGGTFAIFGYYIYLLNIVLLFKNWNSLGCRSDTKPLNHKVRYYIGGFWTCF